MGNPNGSSRPPDHAEDPVVRWRWVWLVWALVALVFASQNVVGAVASGAAVDWNWAVYHEILYWSVWGALTPVILRWSTRHRLVTDAGWRPWLAHLGLAAVIAPAHIAAAYGLHGLSLAAIGQLSLSALPGWLMERRVGFLVIALTGFWKYAAVVGVFYAVDYYGRWRREQEQVTALAVRAARLEGRLARSRLAALRSQLRPHFLFNTLNSIAVLVREAPRDAEEMLRRLSGLLRQTLERDDVEEVSLEEELDFLERYLDIQRTRYEERLQVEIDVESRTLQLQVPFLVLQPLVENAVNHGVEARSGGAIVRVEARRSGSWLGLSVVDRPVNPAPAADVEPMGGRSEPPAGTGLANLRERLEQLYGDSFRFEAGPRSNGGFSVRIEIPVRAASPTLDEGA